MSLKSQYFLIIFFQEMYSPMNIGGVTKREFGPIMISSVEDNLQLQLLQYFAIYFQIVIFFPNRGSFIYKVLFYQCL